MTEYIDTTILVTSLLKSKQEFIVAKTGIPRQVLFDRAIEEYLQNKPLTIDPSYADKRRKVEGRVKKDKSLQYKVKTDPYIRLREFVDEWNKKNKRPLYYIKLSDVFIYALENYFNKIIIQYQLIT